MARSSYIYVVHRGAGPIAAFTVKRELHREARANGWYTEGLRVSRCADGRSGTAVQNNPLTEDY
jgi:hypothetical protein